MTARSGAGAVSDGAETALSDSAGFLRRRRLSEAGPKTRDRPLAMGGGTAEDGETVPPIYFQRLHYAYRHCMERFYFKRSSPPPPIVAPWRRHCSMPMAKAECLTTLGPNSIARVPRHSSLTRGRLSTQSM